MSTVTKLYRYERWVGEYIADGVLKLRSYTINSETLEGYWINLPGWPYKSKWVSKTAKKRFAYPTEQEALNAFIARTKRCKLLSEYQIKHCNHYLNLAGALSKSSVSADSL